MTRPGTRPPSNEPPALVQLPGVVRTAGGSGVVAAVRITNRASAPRVMLVTAMGVDSGWLPLPLRSGIVAPGETVDVPLTLTPAMGTLPARYPFVVTVQTLDPRDERVTSSTSLAESVLLVDAPGSIDVAIEPMDAGAVFRKRVSVVVHNTGMAPAPVDLEARHTDRLAVRFETNRFDLGPAETRRIRARIRVRSPQFVGDPERHAYTVTARSAGAPRHVQGALTARAMLGAGPAKIGALIAVIAIWAALAAIFVPKLANAVHDNATKALDKAARDVVGTAPATPGASGGSSGAPGSGSGTSGPKGPDSSGGPGSSGGPDGGPGSAAANAAAKLLRLSGTVSGAGARGVTVQVDTTTLLDPEVTNAQGVGISTNSLHEIAMVPAAAVENGSSRAAVHRKVQTKVDGAWSFSRLPPSGYYMVTFAEPGYQTQRYFVDAKTIAAAQPLKVTMQPGTATLSGMVRTAGGQPVGSADITISDGTTTITSSTNSSDTNNPGAWSVSGLTTPATYLVSASKHGLGLESALVTFTGGGHSTVNLTLRAGVGALTGTVYAAGVGNTGSFGPGIGGATVTATDGTLNRSATTITTAGHVGEFRLPDLPSPATYIVTVTAPGYQTQTLTVSLRKGQPGKSVSPALISSTAIVEGKVLDASGARPGAGLTLTSPDNTYKIMSTDGGKFQFNGVAPGSYVLSAEYFGKATAYKSVTAIAGVDTDGIVITLDDLAPPTYTDAAITGTVASAIATSGELCNPSCTLTFRLTDSAGNAVTLVGNTIQSTLHGPTRYTLKAAAPSVLSPGQYQVSVSVSGYLPGSTFVEVPINAVGVAPQLNLYPANKILGTLSANNPLSADPYDAATTYTNCVWAIPNGDKTPADTCDTNHEPDQTPCTDRGKPAPKFADVNSDGTYTIDGLCDGTYVTVVRLANPYFKSPAPDSSFSISHGTTQTFSPHVPRLGRVVLTIATFNPGTGTTAPLANTSVTASCDDPPVATPVPQLKTNGAGQVLIWGLPDNNVAVNCRASYTDPSSEAQSGTVGGVVGVIDGDTGATIVMTKANAPAFGRVVRSDQPNSAIGGAAVTMIGTTGFTGSTPQTATANVLSNDNGCFGIVPKNYDLSKLRPPTVCTAGGATLTVDNLVDPSKPGNLADLGFISPTVTVSASADHYGTRGAQSVTLATQAGSGASPAPTPVPLVPQPDAFSGKVSLAPGHGTPDGALPGVSVQVTAKPAGAGTISASVDAFGNLHWLDSNIGATDQIWPGDYTVRVSLPGYSGDSTSFTCALGPTTCTASALQLDQLGSVAGTVTGYLTTADTLSDFTGVDNQQVGGATVTLTKCTDSTCNSLTGTPLRTTTDANGNYAFGSPGAGSLTWGSWQLRITAPGWRANELDSNNKSKPAVVTTLTVGASAVDLSQSSTMLLNRVSLQVQLIRVDGSVYSNNCQTGVASPGCPTLRLTTLAGAPTYLPDPTANPDGSGNYIFSCGPTCVPPLQSYWLTFADSSGSVKPGSQRVDVTLPPTDQAVQKVPVPVTLTNNTLTGKVSLTKIGTGTTTAKDIPISIGQGTTPADFVIARGTDGHLLSTVSAADGTFSIGTVQGGGPYQVLYNDPNAATYDGTYQTVVATQAKFVFDGQSQNFDEVTLPRSSAPVVVSLTPKDPADKLDAAVLTLTSKTTGGSDYSNPALDTTTPGVYKWTFNDVTADSYTLTVGLPDGHFGQLSVGASKSDTMSCTGGSATTAVSCTGTVAVKKAAVNETYGVDEFAVPLSVVAQPLAADPNGTPPATATLTVKDSAVVQNTVVSDNSFTVSTSAPATPTALIWGRAGQTYTASVTTTAVNWPVGQQTFISTTPANTVIGLAEIGAKLAVHVTIGGKAMPKGVTADVTLTSPGGGIVAPPKQTTDSTTDDATFSTVPFAADWIASGTADTVTGQTTTTHTGSTPKFTIDSTTVACTAAHVCTITENLDLT